MSVFFWSFFLLFASRVNVTLEMESRGTFTLDESRKLRPFIRKRFKEKKSTAATSQFTSAYSSLRPHNRPFDKRAVDLLDDEIYLMTISAIPVNVFYIE